MADGIGGLLGRLAASASTYFVLALAASVGSLFSAGTLNGSGPHALGSDLAVGVCCAVMAAGLWVAAAIVATRTRA